MARKIISGALGLMLAWLGAASLALAQPGGPGNGPGKFQDRFLEVKRSQMGAALSIDQRTVDRLLLIEQRYKPMRQQLIGESKTEFLRLKQVMSQPNPPEQEVVRILTSMEQKQREMEKLKQRQNDEEKAALSPVQYARYILYLQGLMREARGSKGGPPRGMPLTPMEPREIPVNRPMPASPMPAAPPPR